MKANIITILIFTVLTLVLLCPVQHTTTIVKSDVKTIQPFAGKVNGNIVGTSVACKYLLEKESIPDTLTVSVVTLGIFSVESYVKTY